MLVMLVTPCLAQEVETEGIFSVEGTLWRFCGIGFITFQPFVKIGCDDVIGFDQDTVYICSKTYGCNPTGFTHIDSPLVSIVFDTYFEVGRVGFSLFILQPIGFGVFMSSSFRWGDLTPGLPIFAAQTGILFKVDDNWTPPEVE